MKPICSVAAVRRTEELRYDDPRVVHQIDSSSDAYRPPRTEPIYELLRESAFS